MEVFFWILGAFGIAVYGHFIGVSIYKFLFFHPFFLMIAGVYGALQFFLADFPVKTWMKYALLYLLWWLFSILLGGPLYTLLDMMVGYFVTGEELYNKLLNDLNYSCVNGNYLIFTSVPLNILVWGLSFILLYKREIFKKQNP